MAFLPTPSRSPQVGVLLVLLAFSLAHRASACPGGCTQWWRACPQLCKARKDCWKQVDNWVQVCVNGNCWWENQKKWVRGWRCRPRTCRASCSPVWPACDAKNCFRAPCGSINGQPRWYCKWRVNACRPHMPVCPAGSSVFQCSGPPTPTYRCAHTQPNGSDGPGSLLLPSGSTPGQKPKGGKKPHTGTKPKTGKKPKGDMKPIVGMKRKPRNNPKVTMKPTMAGKKPKIGKKSGGSKIEEKKGKPAKK